MLCGEHNMSRLRGINVAVVATCLIILVQVNHAALLSKLQQANADVTKNLFGFFTRPSNSSAASQALATTSKTCSC
ncbi:hypothetical protein B566_EDAN004736, partial [Ephemera danica]